MDIDKFNVEGYYDPTAYEAVTKIEREAKKLEFKALVYICSPYAGDTERNTRRAQGYSRFAVSRGVIPIAPHLLFPQFMDDSDKQERTRAILMGLVLISKCKEVWRFGNKISEGMAAEIDFAKRHGITVRCFNDRCEELRK